MIAPPFPQVVRIEPASACNLRCVHCPTGTLQMPRMLMQPALFDKIAAEISSRKIRVFVLYHGGEPFLNKDIFRQIDSLRSSHPHALIKTVSNGMLLDDEMIEKICLSSLSQIEFSLDGLSPGESNNIRRGSDSFKTIESINKLLRCISETGSTLKVAVSTTQFFDLTPDGKTPLADGPSVPEWLIDSCNGVDRFKATWAMEWPRMMIEDTFTVAEFEGEHADEPYMNSCDHLSDTITIRANGDIVPCCYDLMSDLVMGNIAESPIMEIWSSQKYTHLRQSIALMRPPLPCSNCNVITKKKRYLIKRK